MVATIIEILIEYKKLRDYLDATRSIRIKLFAYDLHDFNRKSDFPLSASVPLYNNSNELQSNRLMAQNQNALK